jgi:hypothetical protein
VWARSECEGQGCEGQLRVLTCAELDLGAVNVADREEI